MASENVTLQTNVNECFPKNFKVLFHRPPKCYCNEIENVSKPQIFLSFHTKNRVDIRNGSSGSLL